MNTATYTSKKNDEQWGRSNIIPFAFPPIRDVTQPLGKKVPPGANGSIQRIPDWDKRGR